MAQPPAISLSKGPSSRDIGFAMGIVTILCILFLPKGLFGEVSALAFARRQLGAAWRAPDGSPVGWR